MATSTLRFCLMLCFSLFTNAQPQFTNPTDYSSLLKDLIAQNLPAVDQCRPDLGRYYGCYIQDGSMWSLPLTIDGEEQGFWIVHTTYDWSFLAIRPGLDGVYGNFSVDRTKYDDSIVFNPGHWNGNGFVTLLHNVSFAGNITMPTIDQTGFRNATCKWNAGDCWDSSSFWLNQAYRIAWTSLSDRVVDHNWLVGFAHNEDVYGQDGQTHFKHVGVRYSNDSGRSWTRSVPILTRKYQDQPRSGTGDMSVWWNYRSKVWQALTTEDPGNEGDVPGLIMAYSSDVYARPGTWCRIEPKGDTPRAKWRTAPGYHLDNTTLYLRDTNLTADINKRCQNPSVIFDSRSNYYHMICQIGPGGLRYSNSSDGWIWTVPINLTDFPGSTWYPSLLGQGSWTTDGTARLWYWNRTGYNPNATPTYRQLWAMDVQFPEPDQPNPYIGGDLPGCDNTLMDALPQTFQIQGDEL